ncbi:MAG TPA: hypothetical protein VFS39_18410 [Nitrospira sp.]|nr:hypothetical protein [Nitrospira sp.]
MANGYGGYRTPSKPAPVSGPGRLSRRTDGGPTQKIRDIPSQSYGDGVQFRSLEQAAPMAANDVPQPSPNAGGAQRPPVDVIPLNAPTTNPDEPVTAGSPLGPGPGLESLGLVPYEDQVRQQDAAQLAQYLPVLEYVSNLPGATPSMRAMVRRLKGILA